MTALLLRGGRRTFLSLRKHRNYRLFFSGQVVSVSGTWMQNIAMYWFVLHADARSARDRDPLVLPLRAVHDLRPLLRRDRGSLRQPQDGDRHAVGADGAQRRARGRRRCTGHATAWHVYAIAALSGTALVLDAPARQSLTFQMVGRDELPNAIALNSSLFNIARIAGPALGGVVIAAVGVGWCFAANAVSFLAVLTSLLLMRPAEFFSVGRHKRPTFWRGTREGLSYVRRSRSMLVILGMMVVFASLCFNFNILLPVLAKQTLDAGPRTFGVLSAAFGFGALIGALRRPRSPARAGARCCSAPRASRSASSRSRRCSRCRSTWCCSSPAGSSSRPTPRTRTRGSSSTRRITCAGACSRSTTTRGTASRRSAASSSAGSSATGGTELAFAVAGTAGLAMAIMGALAVRAPRSAPIAEELAEPGEELAAA